MYEKTTENTPGRRMRIWSGRIARTYCRGYIYSLGNIQAIVSSCTGYTQKIRRKHKDGFWFRILKETKGTVNSVEFLIYLTIVLFLLFGGVDYFVTQVQLSMLEHTKDYYVDRMRLEGNLTDELKNELKNELENKGFTNIEITVVDNWGTPVNSTQIITRNVDDINASILELRLKASPKFVPFMFGRLIGINEDTNFYFMVKGKVLSEKPIF